LLPEIDGSGEPAIVSNATADDVPDEERVNPADDEDSPDDERFS
jgi:hypothetical protein